MCEEFRLVFANISLEYSHKKSIKFAVLHQLVGRLVHLVLSLLFLDLKPSQIENK